MSLGRVSPCCLLGLVLIAAVSAGSAAARGSGPDACALIPRSEASRVVGAPVRIVAGHADGSSCNLLWRKGGAIPNVNPHRPRQNGLDTFRRTMRARGHRIIPLSSLGAGAFASVARVPGFPHQSELWVGAVRNGWLLVLQSSFDAKLKAGPSIAQLVALTRIAYRRL